MQGIDLYKWVNEARQGQEAAWNFLYKFFQPHLYTTALNIHGNTPAAKDAVQDCFMIAFLQLNKLKDPMAFPAWIKKILIHNCYRAVHKIKNSEKKELWQEEKDISFEMKMDELNKRNRLFEALEQLPEILKTTVLLRYFSRHSSYDEMATILSVPVGTIRSRLNKAKTILSGHWKNSSGNETISRQSEEWNRFYIWIFEEYMRKLEPREKLVNHMENNMELRLTSGKNILGKQYILRGLEDDVQYGIAHEMVNAVTCGQVSVIEFNNINSKEFPDHCPAGAALVVHRHKDKITRMYLYDVPR